MCIKMACFLQAEAEEACEVEFENSDGLTQPQCARLEQFEDFVRQMVGEGHIVNFVTTLQSLSHANKRRLAKDLEAAGIVLVCCTFEAECVVPGIPSTCLHSQCSLYCDIYNS